MTKKTKIAIPSEKIKDHWCSYSLQQLAPKKFAEVARNILRGKYKLLVGRKPLDGSEKSKRSS